MCLVLRTLMIGTLTAASGMAHAQTTDAAQQATTGMAMQEARANMMTQRGQQVAYDIEFDLSGLPEYAPTAQVEGEIVFFGSNYITDGYLGGLWEDAFREFHPNVEFSWNMKTSRAAMHSVSLGIGDIGIGRTADFGDIQMFQRYLDRDSLIVEVATGSFDVVGWNPGFGVVVHEDNPLAQISMEQLDGIFGAERLGGWEGTDWHPEWARGPEENIRTWGDLGLEGEWADKEINVYGLNARYTQTGVISNLILAGSDKWNERLRIYANYVSPEGQLSRDLNVELANDPYGIAILGAPTSTLGGSDNEASLKVLPLARTNEGPFVPYTIETLQDRSYPMYDQIFAYADPQTENPAVREFLEFVVSRQGQELVMQDAKYLPFTAEVSQQQLDVIASEMQ